MEQILDVVFRERKSAEDLYWCQSNGKILLRQPCDDGHVRWLTTTEACEADCSVRSGITIRVLDSVGCEVFRERVVPRENGNTPWSDKKAPFSYEAIKTLERKIAGSMSLRSYEEWKTWLMGYAKSYGYFGYADNWLYDAQSAGYEKRHSVSILGRTAHVTARKTTHSVCGKVWTAIELMDAKLENCLGICGFLFEEPV